MIFYPFMVTRICIYFCKLRLDFHDAFFLMACRNGPFESPGSVCVRYGCSHVLFSNRAICRFKCLFVFQNVQVIIWAATWQNKQSECALSEDSDQPGRPPSLIRVFAVRMKKPWVHSYPLSAQRRLWSDWADAQADLSLRWAHTHFVGFVTSRLKYVS